MSKTRKPRIRPHGQLPAGWQWRDARPRWIPSPTLRKAGWKGHDLRDGAGQWLARGPSIDKAEQIVREVAAWRAGQPVSGAFAAIAPPGAVLGPGAASGGPGDPFALGTLADAFLEEIEKTRSKGTHRDYRGKLTRLIDALAGYAKLPDRKDAKGQAARAAAVAELRAMPIFAFAPYEGPKGMVDDWTWAYRQLKEHAGINQAYGVFATASAFLTWVNRYKTRKVPGKGQSWASAVERETPAGRVRPLTWEEVQALYRTADRLGEYSIADAVVLAFAIGWSEADVLNLSWPRVVDGRAHTGQAGRIKTGRVGGTPILDIGLARLALIKERQAKLGAKPTHVIWGEPSDKRRNGGRWASDTFRHKFAAVRAEAVKDLASLADVTFADLRDTQFTLMIEAGLTDEMKSSRTLQSLKNIATLSDNNYGQIGVEVADQGAALMNALLARKGIAL
jgi:integrase